MSQKSYYEDRGAVMAKVILVLGGIVQVISLVQVVRDILWANELKKGGHITDVSEYLFSFRQLLRLTLITLAGIYEYLFRFRRKTACRIGEFAARHSGLVGTKLRYKLCCSILRIYLLALILIALNAEMLSSGSGPFFSIDASGVVILYLVLTIPLSVPLAIYTIRYIKSGRKRNDKQLAEEQYTNKHCIAR